MDLQNSNGPQGDGSTTDAIVADKRQGRTEHKDIGQIQASELDGITINRTKNKISPFVPIIKTPNYAENSGNLTGYSVEIEDPSEETGYRHLGNVGANYLLLPNEDVRELGLEIVERSGAPFKESRIFWDGARFAHVIDLLERHPIAEGDEVSLSLITRSSYDKSWRYECALMGKRFLCDNGVLSGEFFSRVSFRHMKATDAEADNWKEIVREGLSVLNEAPANLKKFVQGLRILRGHTMTDEHLREVWMRLPGIGDTIMGKIMARYVSEEEPTLYGFFNAGTNVFYNNEKMTAADFTNNDRFSTGLLEYAFEALN